MDDAEVKMGEADGAVRGTPELTRNPLINVGVGYMIVASAIVACFLYYPANLRPLSEALSELALADWMPWLRADEASLRQTLGADLALAYVGAKVAVALTGIAVLALCAWYAVDRARRHGDMPRITTFARRGWKRRVGFVVILALPFMPLVFLEADRQFARPYPEYWRIYVGMVVTAEYLIMPLGVLMACLGPDIGYPDSPPRQRSADGRSGPVGDRSRA